MIDETWDDWAMRAKMQAVLTHVNPPRPSPLPVQPRKKPIDCQNMETLLAAACTVQEKSFLKKQGGLMALALAAEKSGLDPGGEHLSKKEYEAKHGSLDTYVAGLPLPSVSWKR